ncbi:radical SAM protein [Candidatus Woesearchaeota archaeon]|jgi:radical SAM superfamily enzyme YgiQ (UPF0313 family)|nr:radical SAM protein [Candidatus Woesearchaeota archaeon]
MKILLTGFNLQEDSFPLGLTYLKSFAQKNNSLNQFIIKEFSFGNRFSYDINKNIELQALTYIILQKPDVVAFSCYIWSIEVIKNMARAIKTINPKIKIILGGVEVNESALTKHIEFVIQGEGELAFSNLITQLNKKSPNLNSVPNLIYKKNNKIIKTKKIALKNLDDIPFPYRLKEKDTYHSIKIETTRGCPYSCKYCFYAECEKPREFSFNYLKKNIAYLFKNYQFKSLTILDANLNINKTRLKKVLEIIQKNCKNKKLSVNFELKPELIDQELITQLESFNLNINVELGLQSTDQTVLKSSGRSYDLKKVKTALHLLDTAKFKSKIDLMYGLPGDTFLKFLNSAKFILNNSRKQNQLRAHHFMLLNNTQFFREQENHKLQRFNQNNSSLIIKTNSQDAVDLEMINLFTHSLNEELKLTK